MLLTSWIRALRQSLTRRRRLGHVRRQPADVRQQAAGFASAAEALEVRSMLSIRPLVIDINTVTGNNQFTSTATTPGISITNSTLDPNNDGISDFDDLVIGVSQSSPTQTAFESTIISGAGIGIRINLSNLTGLNHISIDNVLITAGANLQGISVTLDNVALQSLAVDQTTISATSGTLATGLDISLRNMSSTAGVDVSVQNSNIRTGSAAANGINVSLESVSRATHVGELTLTDSTVEGVNVATSANSTLYATIDQASARNNRIQDGAANPAARGITYNLNRTTVGDLRIEKNLNLRNVAVTTIDSPLQTVSISDNPFDVRGFVVADTIRDGIRINASSTNAVGTVRSDVSDLRIAGNTITGTGASAAAAPTVNGIVLALTDSNLGNYAVASAGATVINNTIRNLSSGSGAATGISITASATAAFVAGNANRPLLLDFDGDGTANDLNGINSNTLTANNGRGISVATQAETTFLADISSNSIDGNAAGVAAANRREGLSLTFTNRPTNAGFDSFNVNVLSNTINNGTGTALGVTLQNTAVGSFVIQDNQILNTRDAASSNPDGLAVVLEGTSTTQEATNILRKSFISSNFIGLTKPATGVPSVAAVNNGNGIFVNAQELSSIQDLHIEDNFIQNNRQTGLLFLREDQSTLRSVAPEVGQNRAVTISGNTIGLNTLDGILLDVRNGSTDLLDFDLRNNFIGTDSADPTAAMNLANGGDGIDLLTQADARLLADLDGNTIRFNVGNGIHAHDVFGDFTTDKRQIGGTWTNNTISNNSLSGIVIRGRHGLFDEATGLTTPLVIGLEGQGNDIESNRGNGIRINEPLRNAGGVIVNALASIAVGEVSITNNLIRGNSESDLANEIGPSRAGIFIHSADEKVDIRHNQIEDNFGKGIDIEVVHGIPTLPTNQGLPGDVEVTIRDNVITEQLQIGNEQGDGIELSNFETLRFFSGNRSNNALLNRLDVLALNNFIDSNAGRGVDVLNIGNGTMQLRFGDDTESGRNTIVGNGLDGFRVINTGDPTQTQDGLPTAGNPLGTPTAQQNANAQNSPDMLLDVARNTIRDNGINLPAPVQNGGVSQVNGTGFVILAAGVGFGSPVVNGGENSFAATHPNEVGVNSGDPLAGNGRINLRLTDNSFEGNFGNDVAIVPYIAVIPVQTGTSGDNGSWPVPPTSFAISSMTFDPLVRINAVVSGNTGNGLDVIRPAPDYTNDESWFKSRNRGGGPFGNGSRPRNATRLASDGDPTAATPGFSFVYPGVDENATSLIANRQSGNGSLSPQATTLRIEAGFDRSGTTQGFAFFDPAAPGPGSDDNFDDPVAISGGSIDTIWDTVIVNSFTYPNVDSPTSLRANVTPFTTPRGSTPGVITVNFSEFVRFVDITDFRLLRNGVAVPLESSPGVPLAVSPVGASQDPNNPGAFSSFTIDLTAVTSVAGNYDLQVLVVNSSNPTFTAIRDVHLQLSNQGNTLVRIIDGDGVLQDFALNHEFTVDLDRPVATISAITPDPRNSAAGIVTVNFNEDVTGVDIADFALLRTVGATTTSVVLGSISVTQVSASQYTLNLNQLSGAPGDYELQVVSSDLNTPVFDLAGNLVAEIDAPNQIAASDTWTVDTTLPFITSIADSLVTTTIGSPINAHPASLILNFSENVLGVGVSDFSLVRTNADATVTNIDLSAFPLFSLSASQYELNLASLVATPGTYQFTINPLNSAITDNAGNAFLTTAGAAWVLDVDAPTADVVDVAPDPRQTPVDALNTIFSETVTGVNLAVGGASTQYVLAYDDGTPTTAGSITDATNAGPIVVTANNHGLANGDEITIYGVLGNTNANGVFLVQNRTANTFELAGSAGNGVYAGGGRWVRTVSLAGVTISQQSDTRFVLNLSSLTLNQGTYIVSLLANSGITDLAGNAVGPHRDLLGVQDQFNVAAQDIWVNGPDAAPTGGFSTITSPRGTNAGIVTVSFSEPLAKINNASPVDSKDFRLTRTVGLITTTIVLTSVPITQTGPATYALDLTGSGITDADGTYTLQLLNTDTTGATATALRDLTGNLLSDDADPLTATGIAAQAIWTKNSALSGPQVTSFLDVQRNNTLGTITKLRAVQTLEITFNANVTGIDTTDASKNFLLTRQTTGGAAIPVSLDSVPVQVVSGSRYRLNLSTLTGTDGTYRLTVLANGLIKNAATLVDLLNPQTVTWTKDGTIRPTATASDSIDTNAGNEVVGSGSNYSLRQAVQEANALSGDDIIELEGGTLAAPKVYALTLAGVQEDNAAVGDLDIRENLIIRGKGVGLTIIDATALLNQVTATNRDRVFQILAGVTSATIQGVTIQNGAVTGSEDGGAIRNSGVLTILDSLIQNSTSQDDGGAINNTATLTINRTTIANNTAVATGGAIRNAGTLNLLNSTLNGNRATSHGGGLMNVAGATALVEGVTISTNTSVNGAGGGIRNDGTLRLINDTIASNRSLSTGAGISRNLGTVTIGNTIVSDNQLTNLTNNDVAGTFVSLGGNIIRTLGTATGFAGPQDQLNVNPNLLVLGNYGGPTQTHAIPSTSLAVDMGISALRSADTFDLDGDGDTTELTPFDQRGALRVLNGPAVGNAVDVGAVEFGTFFVNTTADTPDINPGDGLAEDGLQRTSLRAAIMESNTLAGESAIMLDGAVYSLKRLSPDTTAPTVTSILGVPLAPTATTVGVVTINFSEAVGKFSPTITGVLANAITAAANAVTLTSVVGFPFTAPFMIQIGTEQMLVTAVAGNTFTVTRGINGTTAAAQAANSVVSLVSLRLTRDTGTGPINVSLAGVPITKVSDSQYTINLTTVTGTNGKYTLTVETGVTDAEGNRLAAPENVNWVRGVDTFAPTVSITPNPIVSNFITNAGIVTVTFSERVNGVSANNFSLTLNGTPVNGLVVTPVADNNFGGRTVVSLNLTTLTAANGNYVLTLNPVVGAVTTIRDTANINLAAGQVLNWSKTAGVRFEPINNPRVDEVTKIRLQFTERVAGVRLDDFTLTYDDGSILGPQTVDLSQATLLPVNPVTMTTANGNAAEQWELTFSNKQAARDGAYLLNFDGLTNGNVLVTTAGVNFLPTTATMPFQIGEDNALIGDLDIIVGADRVQIFGKGRDDSTTVLGNPQARTVIDGNLTDRIFDLAVSSAVSIDDVELIRGSVVYERNGGAIRNFGTLTVNDSDVGTINNLVVQANVADGNGGGISNSAPTAPVTDVLQAAVNAAVTTLTLNSVATFSITTPFVIQIDSEQMRVTAVNAGANQFTVVRGINGTVAAAHAANAIVNLIAARVGIVGSLQAAATNVAATITLISVAAFPTNVPYVIQVDSEQMQVTAINAALNQFTVSRGFNGTTATAHAAGAAVNLLSTTTLNRTNVQYNLAGSLASSSFFGKGGAVFNEAGALVINEGIYSRNSAMTDGGALYNGNNATMRLVSTLVSANNAGRDGGAIYNNDTAVLAVSSSTLSGNKADTTVNGFAPDSDGDGGAIYNETSATLTLDDSLLQSNSARNGGALYNDDGTLLLNRNEFGLNSALENGGAVFNTTGGDITLNRGLFTTNSASDNGGAIQNFGTLTLLDVAGTGTLFLSNEAGTDVRAGDTDNGVGGAIFNQDGALTITSGTFTLNRSHGDAGVIYNDGDSTLTISRTTFDRNRSDQDGGVLYNNDFSQVTIDESTFSNNTAGGDGGAIFNNSEFTIGSTVSLTIDDSTLNNNAANRGGAIFNTTFGGLAMTNSTLSANDATVSGGALENYGAATLLNATLFLNDAMVASGIASNLDSSSPLAQVSLKNTIVAGGTLSADLGGFDANYTDAGHNLIEDVGPITTAFTAVASANILGSNPQLDVLRNNGGPTLTHFLLFGSPARDAGDNFAVTDNDQRGLNRIFDGDGNGVATIDIGSVESGFVVNSFLDTVDQNPGDGINADEDGLSTLRAAIMEANARSGEDTIILGPGIFTLTLTGRAEDFRLNSSGNIASGSETGDLDILDDLNIIGAGTDLTFINAAQLDRIFQVFPGVILNLSNLTLQDGHATSTDFGGAILNQGQTELDNVLVLNSTAGRGGGVYNAAAVVGSLGLATLATDGTITLTSTTGFNTATPFQIQIDSEVLNVTAVNTTTNVLTVSRAQSGTTAAAHAPGANVTILNSGTLTVTNSLFRGNLAVQQGGALYNNGNLTLAQSEIGATSRLAAAIASPIVTTITVSDASSFPTDSDEDFVIQVDAERMLVTAVAGNQFTVTRGFNGTVATTHSLSAFATLGNFANIHGGGLFNLGIATVTEVSFNGNLAESRGGGVYNAALSGSLSVAATAAAGTLTLSSVAAFPTTAVPFTIQVDNEKMTVTAVNVAANTLTVARGVQGTVAAAHSIGAFVNSVSEVTPLVTLAIEQSTFLDNFASSRGAAVFNEEFLTITNSTITNNDAGSNAALANTVSGDVTINNTTVVDNVAFRGGGLSNSLIGSVSVENTIVANNAATTIAGTRAPNVRGTFVTATNNFIGNNADSTGFANGVSNDQVGSGTSPFDPVLRALADNGGLTLTHATRTGSPVIDTGDNTGGVAIDQRGAIRPTNADSDIGAVEQQSIIVSINDLELKEGNSGSTLFTFTLSLNKTSVQEVRVRYTLQGDTAFAGEDFINATGDVVFAPNQLNQTLVVVVNGDTTVEGDERFLVNLSVDSNALFTPTLDRTQAVGNILSDDTGIRITDVNRVEQSSTSAAQDYVFTVSVVGALLTPNQVVSVNYAIVDGTATIADGDYSLLATNPASPLMFTAGANGQLPLSQTITVRVTGDELVELNENFFINLTSVDLPFEFGKNRGVGTIFNDDLSFTISNASANEGDPVSSVPMTFTVSLDRPVYFSGTNGTPTLATATATIATASATATSGQDFTPVNTTLTFMGTTISQTVDVQIIGDLRFEQPNETFQLQVTAGTVNGVANASVVALSTSGTGTIVDSDPPPDQYHFYSYINAGDGMTHIRVDRIASGIRTLSQDFVQAGALPISQSGDFAGVSTDDLFAIDFNLYATANAADFLTYDTTGVIGANVIGTSNPIPTGGVLVNGLNQVGADTVRFQGGGTFDSVVYDSVDANSGSVTFTDGTFGSRFVNYLNLEPVLDLTSAFSRVFNTTAGNSVNDNIVVSSSGGFVSITSVIGLSLPTFESVTAIAPLGFLVINGNTDNNTIQVNSADQTFAAALTVNGGDGNDTIDLSGWSLLATINGGMGIDNITGGSNDDSIDGGDGNDVINGGVGNDQIFGGLGNDNIMGGLGNDAVDGGDGNDIIQGNDGVDVLSGGNDNDNVDGGAGDETVDGGFGDDIVSGGDGNDVVLGNDGNDQLFGGIGDDSLDGGFGDDAMTGDAGIDTVNGQDGSDFISYTETSIAGNTFTLTDALLTVGTDFDVLVNTERAFLVAGIGNNVMDATAFSGTVTMNGGGGLDTLRGGAGGDSLIGGTGNDSLLGNAGNDTINAGDGNDCITGGLGDDSITGDVGIDTIDGGDGNDNASGGANNDSITGGLGLDTLDGGDGQDILFGNDDADSLVGGAGQDMLDGGIGDDIIDGGDGDDTAFGQTGNDDVRGGAGNDTLEGNDGDDSVNGMEGNDTLNGNAGRDTLFGGANDDELISTDGDDQLLGQGGSADKFTFEGDNTLADIFTITAVVDPNPLTGRVGIGLARLNPGLTFTTVLLGIEVFTLNLNGGNDLVTIDDLINVNDITVLNINGGEGNDMIDASLSMSTTVALRSLMGNGNDTVLGGAGNDVVQGDAGNDTIFGNFGTDSIVGGDGNDSLNGNSDNDTIQGGLGDDSIWGGGGADSLFGLDGKDTIWGQAGADTIDGGNNDDSLDGGYGVPETVPGASGTGNDSIRGGSGNDKIAGRDGLDKLFGDDGNDTILGGDDNDNIDAGTGDDLVSGGNGNDIINGNAGNDVLLGGTGDDSILGGAGNDRLIGEAGKDTVDGQGGTDTVLGGNGLGSNTLATGERRVGESINELFKITSIRSTIFNELNF